MKLNHKIIGNSLLVCAAMVVFSGRTTMAQTTSTAISAGQGQAPFVPARITQAIDETQLVRLKGNVHPLAQARFDQGGVSDGTPMNRMLLLLQRSPEQEAALQQLMLEQQTKGSADYHKWLTPQEFGRRFGPADADIQTITQWLSSQGFQNIKVGTGKVAIEFSGNAGQVRNVFHTEIHHFLVNAKMRQSNVSDPEIPAALSPVVAGIVSLNNFPRRSMRRETGPLTARLENGRIIPEFTGSANQFFAVGPADFAKIYSIPSPILGTGALDGTGVTIAIIGISNVNLQDMSDFRALFGLQPANNVTVVANGPLPDINGEEGEADLDLEVAGMVAPKATVDFVTTEDTLSASGVDLGVFFVIDNNSADVMSLSFGECEANLGAAGTSFFRGLWQQAAAQGITVTVSAGDPGSAGCDDFTSAATASNGLAISGIASSAFNIAVGGTDFDDVGNQATFWNQNPGANDPTTRLSAKGYIPETTWNDSCAATATSANLNTVCAGAAAKNIVAGSGGPSEFNQKPTYQSGITPADGFRDIPDVSLFASDGPSTKSFYLVCQADAIPAGQPPSCATSGSFSFLGAGGTSASSPGFAGIMALIDQSFGRQGNANFVLYKIAQTAANTCNSSSRTDPTQPPPAGCVFNDITKGNISVPCAGKSPNCSSQTSGTNGVLVDPAHTTTPAWTTAPNYDYATGLGSVNVANLVAAWPAAVGTFKGTTTTLTINGSATPAAFAHGTSATAVVTVAPNPGPGTPTGDFSLLAPAGTANGGGNSGTLSGGTQTLTGVILPGGTYNLTAHYAGDTTFAPSDSGGVPVTVNKENSGLQVGIITFNPATGAITSTSATSFAYGSPYILRFDILNHTLSACQPFLSGGATAGCASDATGKVTITDNGSGLDQSPFNVNSAGHGEDQPIQLPAGMHTVVTSYSGDNSYNPSGPVTLNLTVAQAATATAVVPSLSSITSGTMVTLTATVSTNSNGDAPCDGTANTGTVQFLNGSTPLTGTVSYQGTSGAASSTGAASCTATLTTPVTAFTVPDVGSPLWFKMPPASYVLGALCALLLLLLTRALLTRKRAFAYAAVVAMAVIVGGIAGCGGGSSAPPTKTANITAKYSGDTNYSTSTSPVASITVH
jgi:Pro-kumamolisin, activation domain/Bacterial Ig-like domain (group 3)